METSESANSQTFRRYLLFWSGQLISLFGSSVSSFVIIWWITLETGSALYLSLASLLGFAPIIALGPVAGVLADRWNRKTLVAVVDFLQATTTLVLIFLFWSGTNGIWQIDRSNQQFTPLRKRDSCIEDNLGDVVLVSHNWLGATICLQSPCFSLVPSLLRHLVFLTFQNH